MISNILLFLTKHLSLILSSREVQRFKGPRTKDQKLKTFPKLSVSLPHARCEERLCPGRGTLAGIHTGAHVKIAGLQFVGRRH